MIIDYGFSVIGKSHLRKGTVCQDYHRVLKMENGWYIAAIADGVGSAKNSHEGSRIAVESVIRFCNDYMPWDYNIVGIKSMLRTAFNFAFKQIIKESEKSMEPLDSFDTTLSMVIYDGSRIIYGHSGDGAIIGLNYYGDFVEVTKPQKGEDGFSVIPLRAGFTQWDIDTYNEDLASVLLVTDGVYKPMCPSLLFDIEKQRNNIYVPLGTVFADPIGFVDLDKEGIESKKFIQTLIEAKEDYDTDCLYERLNYIYKLRVKEKSDEIVAKIKESGFVASLLINEHDDKTIVGLINTDINIESKELGYYDEPDWVVLKDNWNRKAYPHLYQDIIKNQNKDVLPNSESTELLSEGVLGFSTDDLLDESTIISDNENGTIISNNSADETNSPSEIFEQEGNKTFPKNISDNLDCYKHQVISKTSKENKQIINNPLKQVLKFLADHIIRKF